MLNEPQKIYLCLGEGIESDTDFKELTGVSWCADRVNATDIEYVLATEQAEKQVAIKLTKDILNDWKDALRMATVGSLKKLAQAMYEAGLKDGGGQVSRGYSYHFDRYLNPDHGKEEREFIDSLNIGPKLEKEDWCIFIPAEKSIFAPEDVMNYLNRGYKFPELWQNPRGDNRYYGKQNGERHCSTTPFGTEIGFDQFAKHFIKAPDYLRFISGNVNVVFKAMGYNQAGTVMSNDETIYELAFCTPATEAEYKEFNS